MSGNITLPDISDVVKFKNQDFEKIRTHCTQEGVLWEDPKFIPDIGGLIWERPWEIVSSPCLFLEKAVVHDVRQGLLNNSHVVVAMQALTSRPELLYWVVPKDQRCSRDNSGVAHFRIWQLGTWYDICVDDKLPTKEGKLAYTHSNNTNEFWCALLEKAYAKILGSYKELELGQNFDTMVDLSGGISESIFLSHPPTGFGHMLLKAYEKKLLICGAIDHRVHLNVEKPMNYHDYTITGVKLVTTNSLAVRLKAPKESDEWTCSHSNPSTTWNLILDETRKKLGLVTDRDGEFWMAEWDFKKLFSSVSICHLSPDTFNNTDNKLDASKTWWSHSFAGKWVRGVSAGGKSFETVHQNNQYRFTLVDPDDNDKSGLCSIIISLMQKNKYRQQEWNIGFKIYKLENPGALPSPLGQEFFANSLNKAVLRFHITKREVVHRQKLLAGVYCIVPCTKNRDEEGEFLLRVFTAKKIVMDKSDRKVSLTGAQDIVSELVVNRMVPVAEEGETDDEVVKLFCKVSRKDMTIDWVGLKTILDSEAGNPFGYYPFYRIFNVAIEKINWFINLFFPTSNPSFKSEPEKVTFSKELCRTLISFVDEENSGNIGFDEFDKLWSKLCLWKLIFQLHSKKTRFYIEAVQLRDALEKAGFILNSEVLGVLIHRFTDERGHMTFDDFIMCIATLQLDMANFTDLDKENTGQVVVTLNEWIEKSLSY